MCTIGSSTTAFMEEMRRGKRLGKLKGFPGMGNGGGGAGKCRRFIRSNKYCSAHIELEEPRAFTVKMSSRQLNTHILNATEKSLARRIAGMEAMRNSMQTKKRTKYQNPEKH